MVLADLCFPYHSFSRTHRRGGSHTICTYIVILAAIPGVSQSNWGFGVVLLTSGPTGRINKTLKKSDKANLK